MKRKEFKVRECRIYGDMRDKYVDYMGEEYNMLIWDDSVKNDVREMVGKGSNKSMDLNMVEKK